MLGAIALALVDFELEQAIASLRVGQAAIPIWLDTIHRRLLRRLKERGDRD